MKAEFTAIIESAPEGGSHSIWINPKSGITETIPRHTEIKEPLARKILRNLSAE